MNLYLINNKQEKTPTVNKGAYYCSHVLVKAETKAKAKRLMNEPWFTSTKPVLVEDDIRSKQSKIVNIVLKPMEGN